MDTQATEPNANCGDNSDSSSSACSTKFTREDLKAIAGARCIEIFADISEDGLQDMPQSVVRAWKVGRDLSNL